MVVLQVAGDGGQAVIALGPRLVEGLPEQVQLELRGGLDPVAGLRRPLELASQDPARRLLDRLALLGVDVAEDQRGLRQPGQEPPGAEVRTSFMSPYPRSQEVSVKPGSGAISMSTVKR
jgi:hypothetical protein